MFFNIFNIMFIGENNNCHKSSSQCMSREFLVNTRGQVFIFSRLYRADNKRTRTPKRKYNTVAEERERERETETRVQQRLLFIKRTFLYVCVCVERKRKKLFLLFFYPLHVKRAIIIRGPFVTEKTKWKTEGNQITLHYRRDIDQPTHDAVYPVLFKYPRVHARRIRDNAGTLGRGGGKRFRISANYRDSTVIIIITVVVRPHMYVLRVWELYTHTAGV